MMFFLITFHGFIRIKQIIETITTGILSRDSSIKLLDKIYQQYNLQSKLNFLYQNHSLSIMATKTKANFSILSLIVFIVLGTIQSFSIASIAYGQEDLLPFEIGEISESKENINTNTSTNSSNSTNYEKNDEIINCEMPPCPPGQACIQSCPEVSIQ